MQWRLCSAKANALEGNRVAEVRTQDNEIREGHATIAIKISLLPSCQLGQKHKSDRVNAEVARTFICCTWFIGT